MVLKLFYTLHSLSPISSNTAAPPMTSSTVFLLPIYTIYCVYCTILCILYYSYSTVYAIYCNSVVSEMFSLCVSQPYFSTRVNAAEINLRVKQLDQSIESQTNKEGDKKVKAGFWEEFDVSLILLASLQGIVFYQS